MIAAGWGWLGSAPASQGQGGKGAGMEGLLVLIALGLAVCAVCGWGAVAQPGSLRREVERLKRRLAATPGAPPDPGDEFVDRGSDAPAERAGERDDWWFRRERPAPASDPAAGLESVSEPEPAVSPAGPPPAVSVPGDDAGAKPSLPPAPVRWSPPGAAFQVRSAPTPPSLPPSPPPATAAASGMSRLEETLGRQWTVWAGVLILLVGVAFFIKYSFDQGWVNPAMRVGSGIVAGLVMTGLGVRFHRRQMRPLGQGLMGGGLGLLYLSLYGGYAFYDELIPLAWAFGGMAATTALGVVLAVVCDAQPICALAAIGGFLTPMLLSTGKDARDTLFTYVMVLDLGVLSVAWFRRWRFMDGVALAGTALLYTGWASRFCHAPASWPAVTWLAAFYAVFLLLPFIFNLRRRQPTTPGAFALAVVCAAYFLAMAAVLAGPRHTNLAWAACAAAAAYAVLGLAARLRIPQDQVGPKGFAALSMIFAALAPAIAWKLYGPTLSWAAEAVALVALGCFFRSKLLRAGGNVLLALAGFRLLICHDALPRAGYVFLGTRESGILWAVVLAGAVAAMIHHRFRDQASPAERGVKIAIAILTGLTAIIGLHRELWHWRALAGDAATARWLVTLLWTAGAAAYMAAGVWLRCAASRVASLAALFIALILAAVSYDSRWPDGALPVANPRFLSALAAVAATFATGWALLRFKGACDKDAEAGPAMHGVGVFALFLLLSAEAGAACGGLMPDGRSREWMTQMVLSLTWAAYASALLGFGFWRRLRPVRFAGLAVFALAALKVVFVDMASARQLYRIISFIALGLLMIGASYAYHRLERPLGKAGETAAAPRTD